MVLGESAFTRKGASKLLAGIVATYIYETENPQELVGGDFNCLYDLAEALEKLGFHYAAKVIYKQFDKLFPLPFGKSWTASTHPCNLYRR